jgi:uncharacterized protein YndB with AHSA1/START domain
MASTDQTPTVTAQMRIRKPVHEVFNAFVDPEITRNFWFTKGSGKLEAGRILVWEWEMYNVSTEVHIEEIKPDEEIVISWGEPATKVVFSFQSLSDNSTYVSITNTGFSQQGSELWAVINDSTGGFTTALDGAKAWLEFNINLNLIADKFPKEVSDHGA